ncbi:MAG: lytic transglycosylase domain-containing protein [Candidatus Omnitrophota bacterium]
MNRKPLLFVTCFCLLLSASFSVLGRKAAKFDIVFLKNDSQLEGCVTVESETHLTVETIGGAVVLPLDSLTRMERAAPGESALFMANQLLDKKNYDRAARFLKKADAYSAWKTEIQAAWQRMQTLQAEDQQKENDLERIQIERLIERKGLQAGIEELQRRHRQSEEDEYWGSYRGRLHLIIAKERLDHLDFQGAERQLTLAEQYGIAPEEWKEVRDKIIAMKRDSLLHGREFLEAKVALRGKKTGRKPADSSNFLTAVETAEKNGEPLPPLEWLRFVDQYSRDNEINPLLVWALIDVESAWQRDIVSSKGAQGLMQLMPPTADDLNVDDPFDPEENIRGGTQYLRFLLSMFNDRDTALAAYNVGPGRVEKTGVPPAGKRYIAKVTKRLAALQERFGVNVN